MPGRTWLNGKISGASAAWVEKPALESRVRIAKHRMPSRRRIRLFILTCTVAGSKLPFHVGDVPVTAAIFNAPPQRTELHALHLTPERPTRLFAWPMLRFPYVQKTHHSGEAVSRRAHRSGRQVYFASQRYLGRPRRRQKRNLQFFARR